MSFKNISLGRYVYGTSLLHRLDPRTKLVCLLVLMCGLFVGGHILVSVPILPYGDTACGEPGGSDGLPFVPKRCGTDTLQGNQDEKP